MKKLLCGLNLVLGLQTISSSITANWKWSKNDISWHFNGQSYKVTIQSLALGVMAYWILKHAYNTFISPAKLAETNSKPEQKKQILNQNSHTNGQRIQTKPITPEAMIESYEEDLSDYSNQDTSESNAQDIVAESSVAIGNKRYFMQSQIIECDNQRFDFKKREIIDLNTQTIKFRKADSFRWYVLNMYQKTITPRELEIIKEWATTRHDLKKLIPMLEKRIKSEL